MDPNSLALLMGSAGGAAAGPATYVEDVFQTWLYTGNSSTQTITNGVDLAGKGGLVWCKRRSSTGSHGLFDTERGIYKTLYSNFNYGQDNLASTLTAFNSDGFSLSTNAIVNASSETYASWTFRKAAKFFDVVTWVGDGTSSRSISHALGSTPGFIVVKRTSAASDWWCWHRSISTGDLNGNNLIVLNTTAAQTNGLGTVIGTASSTSFQVGGDSSVNASGSTYVAYLFAHDAGGFGATGNDSIIKCGTFTSDGSGNATVDLGWEPQWIMAKPTGTTANWIIYDALRGFDLSTSDKGLCPNLSSAEFTYSGGNPYSTGFVYSDSGYTSAPYIYIAIRRGPMKTPTDATKVFSANIANTTEGTAISTGFAIDLQVNKYRPSDSAYWVDRLRGVSTTNTTGTLPYLSSTSTDAEANNTLTRAWNNDGFAIPTYYNNASTVFWNFRRAPGFFDVVAYTGTGANIALRHNLGSAPELVFIKKRSDTGIWITYSKSIAIDRYLQLNGSGGSQSASGFGDWPWNNTAPTASVFNIGYSSLNNSDYTISISGQTYIAYLFASCPGVSKVGSYTGTGTTLSIDCGFTNGARFVMIKRTDSSGDWYIWDTARGIIAANDPYLLLNSTAAEVTNTDYIDPLSSGFQISSTAPAAINANGGSFIYLAIA